MSQDKCTIHVNGVELEARPGQMLIEVTDAADVYVPRFCYHPKLSIAANCRMCLVEVENAPKPMPACATPVAAGMKVWTKSAKAIGAQRATMEFLLINHPLDCPICDQGGECELQDLAMGFGRDISRYAERKRVVKDKNIGPLVSTDMTRCIHCTRCVRFTQEVAGFQELGTIGRGDRMEISPYIERSVNHELSGNIIDLCPVGALNSKPYRFSARAWEMAQSPTVSPHDGFGSRLYAHVMDGRVKRVVPESCDSINETWITDRDRFSYEGMYAPDRLQQPMIREGDAWRAAGWDEALDYATGALRGANVSAVAADVAALVSPSATVEEGYLLSRLMAHLGSASIDHRLRQRDFRGQQSDPAFPWLGMDIAAVQDLEQVLIVGSNIRSEVPLLAHRLRKAAMGEAGVHFVNPARFPYLFPVGEYLLGDPRNFWQELATLVKAATPASTALSPELAALVDRSQAPEERHRQLVGRLREASRSAVFIGQISLRHPDRAAIELLARELARLTSSSLGYVPEGANAVGLALAGALPHRGTGGALRSTIGAHAGRILSTPPRVLVLFGIEPELDCANGQAPLTDADCRPDAVIAFSPFLSDSLRKIATVVLPVATFAETAGTFVNIEGRWQSFAAASRPVGESRPGWKVLRVLGNRLGMPDCDYDTAESVRDELHALVRDVKPDNLARMQPFAGAPDTAPIALAQLDVPIYQIDGLVRRAISLQQTDIARVSASWAPVRLRA